MKQVKKIMVGVLFLLLLYPKVVLANDTNQENGSIDEVLVEEFPEETEVVDTTEETLEPQITSVLGSYDLSMYFTKRDVYVKGVDESFTIEIDEKVDINSVKIDDIDAGYSVAYTYSGRTIYFGIEELDNLAVGLHTVTVESTGGKGTLDFIVKNAKEYSFVSGTTSITSGIPNDDERLKFKFDVPKNEYYESIVVDDEIVYNYEITDDYEFVLTNTLDYSYGTHTLKVYFQNGYAVHDFTVNELTKFNFKKNSYEFIANITDDDLTMELDDDITNLKAVLVNDELVDSYYYTISDNKLILSKYFLNNCYNDYNFELNLKVYTNTKYAETTIYVTGQNEYDVSLYGSYYAKESAEDYHVEVYSYSGSNYFIEIEGVDSSNYTKSGSNFYFKSSYLDTLPVGLNKFIFKFNDCKKEVEIKIVDASDVLKISQSTYYLNSQKDLHIEVTGNLDNVQDVMINQKSVSYSISENEIIIPYSVLENLPDASSNVLKVTTEISDFYGGIIVKDENNRFYVGMSESTYYSNTRFDMNFWIYSNGDYDYEDNLYDGFKIFIDEVEVPFVRENSDFTISYKILDNLSHGNHVLKALKNNYYGKSYFSTYKTDSDILDILNKIPETLTIDMLESDVFKNEFGKDDVTSKIANTLNELFKDYYTTVSFEATLEENTIYQAEIGFRAALDKPPVMFFNYQEEPGYIYYFPKALRLNIKYANTDKKNDADLDKVNDFINTHSFYHRDLCELGQKPEINNIEAYFPSTEGTDITYYYEKDYSEDNLLGGYSNYKLYMFVNDVFYKTTNYYHNWASKVTIEDTNDIEASVINKVKQYLIDNKIISDTDKVTLTYSSVYVNNDYFGSIQIERISDFPEKFREMFNTVIELDVLESYVAEDVSIENSENKKSTALLKEKINSILKENGYDNLENLGYRVSAYVSGVKYYSIGLFDEYNGGSLLYLNGNIKYLNSDEELNADIEELISDTFSYENIEHRYTEKLGTISSDYNPSVEKAKSIVDSLIPNKDIKIYYGIPYEYTTPLNKNFGLSFYVYYNDKLYYSGEYHEAFTPYVYVSDEIEDEKEYIYKQVHDYLVRAKVIDENTKLSQDYLTNFSIVNGRSLGHVDILYDDEIIDKIGEILAGGLDLDCLETEITKYDENNESIVDILINTKVREILKQNNIDIDKILFDVRIMLNDYYPREYEITFGRNDRDYRMYSFAIRYKNTNEYNKNLQGEIYDYFRDEGLEYSEYAYLGEELNSEFAGFESYVAEVVKGLNMPSVKYYLHKLYDMEYDLTHISYYMLRIFLGDVYYYTEWIAAAKKAIVVVDHESTEMMKDALNVIKDYFINKGDKRFDENTTLAYDHNSVYMDSEGMYLGTIKTEREKLEEFTATISDDLLVVDEESEDVIVKVNHDYNRFLRVFLNGEVLDSKNYTVREGSTIVTLKDEYLKTLKVGEYSLDVVFTDGEANTKFNIKEAKDLVTLGDMNNDGILDIIDVKLLLLETFKTHTNSDYLLMDMNKDKVVDIIDVKLLLLETFSSTKVLSDAKIETLSANKKDLVVEVKVSEPIYNNDYQEELTIDNENLTITKDTTYETNSISDVKVEIDLDDTIDFETKEISNNNLNILYLPKKEELL